MERPAEPTEANVGRRLLIVLAWLVGLFVLCLLVGFLIAVPIFTFLYLKIGKRISWLKTLAVSVVMGGIIYGGFEILMELDMFRGILFGGLLPPL